MEKFADWWSPEVPGCYFAMNTRAATSYRKGDQLFNSYGMRGNRFLIHHYGFTMRHNRYNSLGFKVFVNYEDENEKKNHHVKILKLKKHRINEGLFQYLRANMIFDFRNQLRKKGTNDPAL